MKNIINKKCIKQVGFYFLLLSIILGIISLIIYTVGFKKELIDYKSNKVIIFMIIGISVCVILEIFNFTVELAPIFYFAFSFLSFLFYISSVYMYLPGVFYSGINSETLATLNPAFVVVTILLFLTCVLSNISIWLNQSGKNHKEKNNE